MHLRGREIQIVQEKKKKKEITYNKLYTTSGGLVAQEGWKH